MGNFINEEDSEDIYGSIEYNGKTYIMCGIIDKSFDKKYIDKCIGYIFILLRYADWVDRICKAYSITALNNI